MNFLLLICSLLLLHSSFGNVLEGDFFESGKGRFYSTFDKPHCVESDNCFLLFKGATTSYKLTLNGSVLYDGSKSYTKFETPFLLLPTSLIFEKDNSIEVEVYSNVNDVGSLDQSNYYIGNYKNLYLKYFIWSLLKTDFTLASIHFLLLIFLLLSFAMFFVRRDDIFMKLLGYTLTSVIYLVSFSEIPRLFFHSEMLAGGIHFSLRLLQDLFLLILINSLFGKKTNKTFLVSYIFSILCLLVLLPFGVGYLSYLVIMKVLAIQILLPFAIAVKESFLLRHENRIFLIFFSLCLILQVNDLLVFWGVYSGIYTVKIYIPLLVLFTLLMYFRKRVSFVERAAIIEKQYLSSKQTAHDIRSPLEALKSVIIELKNVDHRTRSIVVSSIARISDIANGLLESTLERKTWTVTNLKILLLRLIEDKEFELGIEITLETELSYSDCFVSGNSVAIYRAISNVLNNAYEAYRNGEQKIVKVSCSLSGTKLLLRITDFGCGISTSDLESVSIRGFSTKGKGHGLGLSFSKDTFINHGGSLNISSRENLTTVDLLIPKTKAPDWFLEKLEIKSSTKRLICVDDDRSFLELYKSKFDSTNIETLTVSPEEMKGVEFKETDQFFMDYDLGIEVSGVELGQQYGILHQMVLVTSKYEEIELREAWENFNVRIMPKQIFNQVVVISQKRRKYILIDDDELIHMAWKREAEKQSYELDLYFSVKDFLLSSSKYDKSEIILVDSALGEDVKGEVESEKVFNIGFRNIYLVTGYSKNDINKPGWVIDILGKRPNFISV